MNNIVKVFHDVVCAFLSLLYNQRKTNLGNNSAALILDALYGYVRHGFDKVV